MFRLAASLLLVAPAAGSDNGGYYTCDTALLNSWCKFVISPDAPEEWGGVLREHNVDVGIASPGHRTVQDRDGSVLPVTAKPWTDGDVLVASNTAVTGDSLNYATMFELVAPLRDMLMFHSNELATDSALWKTYTKAFDDCGVKVTDDLDSEHPAYGTDSVYEYIENPEGEDIHHYVLQYLEEGAIDLVCLVTDLEMDRCDEIRAAVETDVGTHCNCWFQAWTDLYGSDPGIFPVDPDDFAACGGAATPATTTAPTPTPPSPVPPTPVPPTPVTPPAPVTPPGRPAGPPAAIADH